MQNAPLGAFCNTLDLHLGIIGHEQLKTNFGHLYEGPLKTGFTVYLYP